MKTLNLVVVNSTVVLALLFAIGSGCGNKDKDARAQNLQMQEQYKKLKSETDKMQEDFKRITECLADPAKTTQEQRATCK